MIVDLLAMVFANTKRLYKYFTCFKHYSMIQRNPVVRPPPYSLKLEAPHSLSFLTLKLSCVSTSFRPVSIGRNLSFVLLDQSKAKPSTHLVCFWLRKKKKKIISRSAPYFFLFWAKHVVEIQGRNPK